MLATKRGEPLPINAALNKPRTKLGLDLPTWMSIAFLSATVFLVGLRLVAMLTFAALTGAAWWIVRKHPRMLLLWFLRWQQKAHYDPRKH
jgi:Type IV secretory pathway, VirB3-like protein